MSEDKVNQEIEEQSPDIPEQDALDTTADDVVADALTPDATEDAVADEDATLDDTEVVADEDTPAADAEEASDAESSPATDTPAAPDAEDADSDAADSDAALADAEDSEDASAAEAAETPEPRKRAGLGTGPWIAIAAVALVAGLFIGATVIGGAGSAPIGKTSVAETDLDTPIATYTYDGNSHDLTIRDSISASGSLEAAKDNEGNYTVPSTDTIVNLARNKVLADEAAKRGVTANEEEVAKYAEQYIGTSDFASLAQQYNMEESLIKEMLTNSCSMNKLQTAVVEQEAGTEPQAPESPKDAEKDGDKTSAKYAEYIIKLVGSEWDAEKGTWASTDSSYAQLLKDYEITADKASYNAAKAAYDMAYQTYSAKASEAWSTFLNNLLSSTSIQVRTLAS